MIAEIKIIHKKFKSLKSRTPFKSGAPNLSQVKANKKENTKEKTTPQKNPSQVLLGEIRGAILCLPNNTPTKYAPTSVIKVPIKT